VIDRFQELLNELGKVFHLQLFVDHHHACSIQIPPLTVQLQLDPSQEHLLLFTKVIEIPPGKFRENVLKETLKANGAIDPVLGIFGYIASMNTLALYQKYPIHILNGEKLAGIFGAFFEMATTWHEAIQQGKAAPLSVGRDSMPRTL
jgi:hypothetical protein